MAFVVDIDSALRLLLLLVLGLMLILDLPDTSIFRFPDTDRVYYDDFFCSAVS